MTESRAQRTLVKSPPELWAEVSDVSSLAKHLGAFGDIRITRMLPEVTVAWEGDRMRGTVTLEPSGWGTKVTLTAVGEAVVSTEAEAEPEFEREPEPPVAEVAEATAPRAEAAPSIVAPPEPEASSLELDPAAPAASEPGGSTPDPDVDPPSRPAKRPGFFARLFGRRATTPELAPEPQDAAGAHEAPNDPSPVVASTAPPEPEHDPAPVVPLVPAVPAPEPEEEPEPAPVDGPEPPAAAEAAAPAHESVDDDVPAADDERPSDAEPAPDPVAVLTGVLDTLGAAHHRPFSR